MLEDPLGRSAISFGLQVHINHFPALVYGASQANRMPADGNATLG